MEIRSFQPSWTQWTPAAANYVRSLTQSAPVPQAQPVEAVEAVAQAPANPQAALRGWLQQYSQSHELYQRVVADPSAEGTLFRRGLMISGVVSLAGVE